MNRHFLPRFILKIQSKGALTMNECLVLDHSIIAEGGEEMLSNRVFLLVDIEMAYSCMACCFNISPLQTHTV